MLPVYTAMLTPADYGIVGAVSSTCSLLVMLTPLGLDTALQRTNFKLLDPSISRERIWGSIVMLVMLVSACACGFLSLTHNTTIRWMSGEIPFWPYVAVGLLGAAFAPIRSLYGLSLQTREMSSQFFWLDLGCLLARIGGLVLMIVALKMGALGMILSGVLVDVGSSLLSLYFFRKHIVWRVEWPIIKDLLPYSLPVIPHALAGWATGALAGVALNAMKGTTDAGLYFMAANLGFIQNSIVAGLGSAFMPRLYNSLSTPGEEQKSDFVAPRVLLALAGFGLTAMGLAAFSPEVLAIMTRPSYWPAAQYVGMLALAGWFQGFYAFYGHLLYFEKRGTRFLPLASGVGAIVSVGLAFWLIPIVGAWGAVASVLGGVVVRTLCAAAAVNIFFKVYWNQRQALFITLLTVAGCLAFSFVKFFLAVTLAGFLSKSCAILVVAALFAMVLGPKPLMLVRPLFSRRR